MTSWVAIAALACGVVGCAAVIDAQSGLAQQAERGVELARSTLADRDAILSAGTDLARQRLDAAFDADVSARPTLDAKWVIAHRKAYAAGIDALHAQKAGLRERSRTDAANLDATAEALRRLRSIQDLQRDLIPHAKEARR